MMEMTSRITSRLEDDAPDQSRQSKPEALLAKVDACERRTGPRESRRVGRRTHDFNRTTSQIFGFLVSFPRDASCTQGRRPTWARVGVSVIDHPAFGRVSCYGTGLSPKDGARFARDVRANAEQSWPLSIQAHTAG